MMVLALGSCLLLLLVRLPPRTTTNPAIAVGTGRIHAGQAD
jgi:hypothetical protein